jgi:hypothetical protein
MNAQAWAQFETRSTTALPEGACCIALGDFNNDGKPDLVVTDGDGFTVSLGNGDGTFQKPMFHSYTGLITLIDSASSRPEYIELTGGGN